MIKIEEVAKAAIDGDALLTRSLAQDFLLENPQLAGVSRPRVADVNILATAAALLELFAGRLNQKAPAWTQKVGSASEPIFLV